MDKLTNNGKARLELVMCKDCGYKDYVEQFVGNGHKCCDCGSEEVIPIGTYNVDEKYFDGYSLDECCDFQEDLVTPPEGMTKEEVLEVISEIACTDLFNIA